MFEVLEPHCEPKRSTKFSAYIDLFAREDVVVGAGETKIVPLGVKLDLENFLLYEIGKLDIDVGGNIISDDSVSDRINDFLKSHYLEVALRSSLGVKGLIIPNGIGIIDLDYEQEIGLIVHNPISYSWNQNFPDGTVDFITHLHKGAGGGESFKISKGDKIAQCTLKKHKGYLMGYESDVVRGGGFGSTGEKK